MKRLVPRNPIRRRKNKRTNGLECSRCDQPRARSGRYCLRCHAAVMREWRASHPKTESQRRKDNARSYANVYKRRGKLVPKPCEECGRPDVQMHHDDYSKPLEVRWLCKRHHQEHHQNDVAHPRGPWASKRQLRPRAKRRVK